MDESFMIELTIQSKHPLRSQLPVRASMLQTKALNLSRESKHLAAYLLSCYV